MELRHLNYFVAIAEKGSITKAAKSLNIAQPPLSRQLKDLENELGFNLFERNKKKKVKLTAQGRFFLEKAKYILNTVDGVLVEAEEFNEQINQKLAIGTTIYSSQTMFKQIDLFKQHNKQILFNIWESNSVSIMELLKERKIDVGYINEELYDKDIETQTIVEDECVCVLPQPIAKLCDRDALTIEELSQLPLILLTSTTYSGLYKQIMDTFNTHQLDANVQCECYDSSMLIQLLSRDYGVTIMPQSSISKCIAKDYVILPILDNPWLPKTKIIWRKEGYTPKIAKSFIQSNLYS